MGVRELASALFPRDVRTHIGSGWFFRNVRINGRSYTRRLDRWLCIRSCGANGCAPAIVDVELALRGFGAVPLRIPGAPVGRNPGSDDPAAWICALAWIGKRTAPAMRTVAASSTRDRHRAAQCAEDVYWRERRVFIWDANG